MSIESDDEFVATLTFSASELDTEDEVEWDRICDTVETRLRAARDKVLNQPGSQAKIIIKVQAKRGH